MKLKFEGKWVEIQGIEKNYFQLYNLGLTGNFNREKNEYF